MKASRRLTTAADLSPAGASYSTVARHVNRDGRVPSTPTRARLTSAVARLGSRNVSRAWMYPLIFGAGSTGRGGALGPGSLGRVGAVAGSPALPGAGVAGGVSAVCAGTAEGKRRRAATTATRRSMDATPVW